MILDRATLRTELFGLVGFYQTNNPQFPTLLSSLLVSRSGRYFNEAHPLLSSIENIDQSITNFTKYNYPDYAPGETYSLGHKVANSGVNYEYINVTPSMGNEPPNETYWEVIDETSDYLIKTVYSGIDEALDEWINAKKMRNIIKSIFDKVLLYNGLPDYSYPEANGNDFVGLKIRPKKGLRSLALIINKIGHQFTGSFESLNLYLYHSSQPGTPLATFPISQTTAKASQWTTLTANNILRYTSDDYDAGGEFYLGYKQSDLQALGAQAIERNRYWRDSNGYKQCSPYFTIEAFSISEANMPGTASFDPDDISWSDTHTYGLNLNLTSKCDLGYFIKEEEQLFAEVIQLFVAKKLMQAIAYSIRGGNQTANQVKVEAKKELFHSTGVWGTLFDRCQKAAKGIAMDLSGIEEACLPCDKGVDDVIFGIGTLH